jgi:hypothetical protein
MSRVDNSYPTGDAGGNGFPLPNHYEVDNLHALWDKVIYTTQKSVPAPFTEATWNTLNSEAKVMEPKYSYT